MSSSTTITQVTVDGFRDLVRHLAQQKGSKARSWCDDWSPEAETGNWDRLSAGDANEKTTRIADTPTGDRTWSRRIAFPATYDSAEATEVTDPSKMLVDPNSNIVRSIGYSLGRQMDDIIFAAAIGNATNSVRAGDGSNTPTSIALGAAQTIGDYSKAISFDYVTEVNEKFNQADLEDEDIVAFIGPRQVRELQNLTEVTSADYVNTQALMSRKIVSGWYGMTWIMSTRLPEGSTGERDCIFMSRRAMGFHIPTDVTTFCDRDPSKSYVWRPYGVFDAGAVRIEEKQVVRLKVLDATVA
jgi:hypothetical protein